MPFDVSTKDCSQLTDSELAEMADLCAETPSHYEIGDLSKQAEAWVLVTQVREGELLRGFSFSTLERIGGTPAIILGLAHVRRNAKRDQVLKAVMNDNYRRALMAFPDEDVLVGTRFATVDGFEAFKVLTDINPRPDHKSSGEERAWGRRLAKRFGMEAGYADRAFVAMGNYLVEGIPNTYVRPEPGKSVELYFYAASTFGDADGQFRLGRMLLEGKGAPRDPRQAARWLQLAASKSHHQAQAVLGHMLFTGRDVPRAAPRGLMFLTLAKESAIENEAWISEM